MFTLMRTALLASLAFIATATPSYSAYIDLFVGTTTGGTVSVSSTGVVGTGISVGFAQGQGTTANDGGNLSITNGLLSFSTGALTSTDTAGNQFFADGGSRLTITGTVGNFTGTLLSATFSGSNPIELMNQGNGITELLGSSIFGTMAPALGSYYNFNTTTSNLGGFSLLLSGLGASPTVNSGNIDMAASGTFIPNGTSVPEPASMAMLAIGLVGTVAIGRRRKTLAA